MKLKLEYTINTTQTTFSQLALNSRFVLDSEFNSFLTSLTISPLNYLLKFPTDATVQAFLNKKISPTTCIKTVNGEDFKLELHPDTDVVIVKVDFSNSITS